MGEIEVVDSKNSVLEVGVGYEALPSEERALVDKMIARVPQGDLSPLNQALEAQGGYFQRFRMPISLAKPRRRFPLRILRVRLKNS